MAMTLRLPAHLEAAVRARAEQDHISQHKVIEAAVAAYTSGRTERLRDVTRAIVTEDAKLLDRLAQ